MQLHPDYTDVFISGVREDLARVTSLPVEAFTVNGLATMAFSVIVEYTINTRGMGVSAAAASNLIDRLLSSNMLILAVVVNVLPPDAFLGPLAAGDTSFLRCVSSLSLAHNGSLPNATATGLHDSQDGGHTTAELVVVGLVPTIALIAVSTAWAMRSWRRPGAPTKKTGQFQDLPMYSPNRMDAPSMPDPDVSIDDPTAVDDSDDDGMPPSAFFVFLCVHAAFMRVHDDVQLRCCEDSLFL